jgi:branched-chain amino acid transport system substrate-binding protein
VRRFAAAVLLAAAALAPGPAGAQDPPLTIYSSLPLQGDTRPQTEDIVRAMQLAIDDPPHPGIRYVSLDDSTADAGKWDPAQVDANARLVAQDASAIAYLGDFNSGASAIAMPILNRAGIPQISPSNTYVGLTRSFTAEAREPENYFPSGIRHYARVAPADHLQALAVCAYLKARKRRRVAIVHDAEVYGLGMAKMVRRCAPKVVDFTAVDTSARSFDGVARRVRRARPDAFFWGGITQNRAVDLWKAIHRRNPRIDYFGPDGVAESSFTARIPKASRARTFITDPTLAPAAYPPAGQRFFERFRAAYGKDPEPYAIYGYEAMALALDAIGRGGGKRADTIAALFATRDRESVLGRYSIDANGDTTLGRYGGYRVDRQGRLTFDRVLVTGR